MRNHTLTARFDLEAWDEDLDRASENGQAVVRTARRAYCEARLASHLYIYFGQDPIRTIAFASTMLP